MPEPFKNMFNEKLINLFSTELKKIYKPFECEKFKKSVLDDNWDNKELKQRMRHISISLHKFLPDKYSETLEILKTISPNFSGFGHIVFPDFVEVFGLENFELSVFALEYFTKASSSEFAVRPFIKKYGIKMMKILESWASSENEDVRRLASEGCRPRLPWAMALPEFKKDPTPILQVITKLKNDPSEYVRRSVANNLNDISKDNPDVVIKIAKEWMGDNPETDWIIKHGCRTLLKKGEPEILELFGLKKPDHIKVVDFKVQNSVAMGETLEFSFKLETKKMNLGKLRVEYKMNFVRKNDRISKKVFKISELNCTKENIEYRRKYSFRSITTRKYYLGQHHLEIVVNGTTLASKSFYLTK